MLEIFDNNSTDKKFVNGKGAIIVVDDDPSQIALVKVCYEKSGRENKLICLESGQEFLNYLENSKNEIPELVLLDINMPQLNGFDVLKIIRDKSHFKEVPIIMMFTTSDADSDKEIAKNLKANAFMSKPSHVADYIQFFQSL